MSWLRRIFGRSEPTVRTASGSPSIEYRVVWRDDSYPTEIVGESNYQHALQALCGGKTRDGHQVRRQALICPEPTNRFDNMAHLVRIDGFLVGYLSRDDARRLAEVTATLHPKPEAISVDALIAGGWHSDDDDEGDFGVRLAMPRRGPIEIEDLN